MVLQKIQNVLAEKLNIDEGRITEKTSFEELGLDSLDIVELSMALEEEFNIEIKTDEAVKTVGDLVSYIEANT